MSDCTDKRFERMLYAYELELLTAAEREALELHLYDCDHCFAEVQRMQAAATQLRESPQVKKLVAQLAGEAEGERSVEVSRRLKPFIGRIAPAKLVPATLAVAAVFLILLLKPFSIEIKPSAEVIAAENRLLIADFRNMVDPTDSSRLGEIAAALLIADLSESKYINVLSRQRSQDIRRVLEAEGTQLDSGGLLIEIARRARAKWLLTGMILREQPSLVLSSQLVAVETGDVIASQRVTGRPGEDIFALVDSLTPDIKIDLWLPTEAQWEPDPSVAEVTTHSAEAYRHYLDGLQYYHKFYWADAAAAFKKAVEFDSTFAMAYYYLARTESSRLIDQALKYINNTGEREQHYIRAAAAYYSGAPDSAISELQALLESYPEEKEALFLSGNYLYFGGHYSEALEYFQRVNELDPLHEQTLNMLAYAYSRLGEFDSAIAAINSYISLAPDDANPYDTRGDIYTDNSKLEQAIASYEMALAKKPDFHASLVKLGCLYIFAGRYDEADSAFKVLATESDRDTRSTGRFYQCYIPVYQGKFREALQVLDDNIAALRLEFGQEYWASFRHLKAVVYQALGNWDLAIAEAERSVELCRRNFPHLVEADRPTLVRILAESGDTSAAYRVLAELKQALDSAAASLHLYWYAAGAIQFSKGNFDSAITLLDTAVAQSEAYWIVVHQLLARAHLEAGHYQAAVDEFERLLSFLGERVLHWGTYTVPSYCQLARAYEGLGDTSKAIEYYEKFLDIWKNADPGLEEVIQARARLRALRS